MNNKKESDGEVGTRMLMTLKGNLQSLMAYHSQQMQGRLQFGVSDMGYLQAWSVDANGQCNFNTVVI